MVKASIIMPTYNRAHFLPRAIASVLTQSIDDWELIVIDDGSTDDTQAVVNDYTTRDARIKYVRIDNAGACVARNTGIEAASGAYITFLDSDDEYYPTKVEAQIEAFRTSSIENLGVVSCGKKDFRDDKFVGEFIPHLSGNILPNLLRKKETIGATTSFLMVKREVIDAGVRFDPQMPAAQDFDFLVQVCLHYNFDFVAEPLVKMNHHSGPRVFTYTRASKAYDLQYTKYRKLLLKDEEAHRGFLNRYLEIKHKSGDYQDGRHLLATEYRGKFWHRLIWSALFANDTLSSVPVIGKVAFKLIRAT